MFIRPPRRFVFIIIVGIFAAILGMLYRHSITDTLFHSTILSSSATMARVTRRPVIVVGSGLAGLSAAHEALQAGAAVHMLDRAPKPGGNSIKASSGINGAGTQFQRAAGVEGDDLFYNDTVRSGGRRFADAEGSVDRPKLVDLLTQSSADAVTWLAEEIGVDLSVVAPLGGHSLPRTHRGAGKTPPGAAIVTTLLKKLGENRGFRLSNSAEVTSLTVLDGVVKGVRYVQDDGEQHDLEGPVVFAAGGFAGDADGLLAKYRPDLAGLPSTNEARPAPHGILEAVGAELVDMDSVQVHPTGFVDPKDPGARYKFLAAEVLRGEGGILLSEGGERFVDEMQTREHVSRAIMRLPRRETEESSRQWDVTLLMDPGACEAAEGHMGFYLWKGLMEKKKVRDLGPAVIRAVDEYAAAVASGTDSAFGRRTFGRWKLPAGEANREEEVCIGRVTPITHFTMGGASFNERAQVLRKDRTAVDGLWAAGEVTGGIHGDNRLGGSSLLECVVFGRIAGREAAKAATSS
ncbi:Putative succinate dehydrogenase/fumarate reductase flavoprotein, catalytic domain superfamily [Colletotrichum destructivum]|uniref:Fumarate reductase n=1 Tax=Colletotrichum destructivum TaxID=34406 RepID=A0AAX4IWK7_9PEZI|nr:Putative succinate dehydrogenase/fumarate reductase flavoprotein, catalytic domain superfamily [Colletotrichum destructivum]